MELFTLYAGKILGKLYSEFPIPIDLEPEAFVVTEEQEFSRHLEVAGFTLEWLASNSYFEGADATSEDSAPTYLEAVLTPKGLDALGAKVDVGGGMTRGDKLVEYARDTTKEANRAAVAEIVGQIVGAAVRGFSS